jgi:2-polyprenyl-3-methyl-5-hydroxy-6-metoxy-1,4-benzoquinol methylase
MLYLSPFLFLLLQCLPKRNLNRGFSLLYSSNREPSIVRRLRDSLSAKDEVKFLVKGVVKSKRSFGHSLSFYDLISYPDLEFCQALLRQEYFQGEHYQGYRKSMVPGAIVTLEGIASPTRNPGEAVLLVQSIKLDQIPRQPQYIKSILSLVTTGELSLHEISQAAHISQDVLNEILNPQRNQKLIYDELIKLILMSLPNYSNELTTLLTQKKIHSPKTLINPPSTIASMTVPAITSLSSIPDLLASSSSSSKPLATATIGFVQNRRRYENGVSVLILVPKLHEISTDSRDEIGISKHNGRLECILHPSIFESADMYGNLLTVSSGVKLIGFYVKDADSEKSTLWVKHASLTRASWRPNTLRYILDLLHQNKLTVEEASQSLLISVCEAEELSNIEDLTIRQWQANQISVKLQSLESNSENDVSPEMLNVLHQYEPMRNKWPVTPVSLPMEEDTITSLTRGLPGSRWQRKKKPQLEWMVQQIGEIINSHEAFGKRTIHILDVGGGQGKLANHLANCYGDQIQVHVIDISRGAVKNGAMRAKRMNLSVQYHINDASKTLFQEQPMDIVVALHACGHLSDVALAHAVQHKAGFVICPCCFLSNPTLRVPGSQETVEHFLQIPEADWWAMKYLAEIQGDFFVSHQAIHTLCAVRADAISRLHTTCTVSLKSFPIQFSTRNLCLVGKVHS